MPKHATAVACLNEEHPIFAVPPFRALFVALFTVMILGTTFAAPPAEAHAVTYNLDIPAQSLESALQAFVLVSHHRLLYKSTLVEGQMAPALKGEFTTEEAMKKLLSGTPQLTFDVTPADAILFRAKSDKSPSAEITGAGGSVDAGQPGKSGAAQEREKEKSQKGDRFRLAQESQGQATSSTSVAPRQKGTAISEPTVEEVVVTAQKREERLQDVPMSISVLGGKDLDSSSYQGVTDALNTVAGVAAFGSTEGGGTQIAIRGVTAGLPTFSGSSTSAYYLDSVPFGFVKSAFAPDPNVYDLQRVEVLRGSQGTLYGANAENGVVRVLTNDADPYAFELKARTLGSTTAGSGGNYGGDVAMNVPIVDGKLAVRGVVDYQNLSGWIDGPDGDHLNDSELRNYRVKIGARPTDELSMGLSAWSTRDNYGAPNNSTDRGRTYAVIPEPITEDYDAYAFQGTYRLPYFSISSSTSYFDYENEGTTDLDIYGTSFRPGSPVYTNFYSRIFSEELILSSANDSAWHWTAGGFYRDGADRLYQDLVGIFTVPTWYTYVSKSYAAFGQIGRRFLSDQVELTLGLRYFHDDVSVRNLPLNGFPNRSLTPTAASFSPTMPRAVLTWYPSRDVTAYASYSEGFRSGFPQSPATLAAAPGFPAARPDRLHNYEFGAKTDFFDKRFSLDSAVYYIYWADIQQLITVPYHNTGVSISAPINGQAASGPGVDLALTGRPVDALELSVSAGWNDLTMNANVYSAGAVLFAKGDRLNFSPEFTGGVSAAYRFAISGPLSGRFWCSDNYTSKLTDRSTGSVTYGTSLTNVRAEISVDDSQRGWTATLFADNLTNNYGAVPGYPAILEIRPRPRTVGLQVDYKYGR
jgi:iron complex outermembrane receptor protein